MLMLMFYSIDGILKDKPTVADPTTLNDGDGGWDSVLVVGDLVIFSEV